MFSMDAHEMRSFASFNTRPSRAFSRAIHSASTSSAKRSSNDIAMISAFFCCSVHAAAIVGRRSP